MSDEDIISIAACTTGHVCAYKADDRVDSDEEYFFADVVCWGLRRNGDIVPIVMDDGMYEPTPESVENASNFRGVWYSRDAALRDLVHTEGGMLSGAEE